MTLLRHCHRLVGTVKHSDNRKKKVRWTQTEGSLEANNALDIGRDMENKEITNKERIEKTKKQCIEKKKQNIAEAQAKAAEKQAKQDALKATYNFFLDKIIYY